MVVPYHLRSLLSVMWIRRLIPALDLIHRIHKVWRRRKERTRRTWRVNVR